MSEFNREKTICKIADSFVREAYSLAKAAHQYQQWQAEQPEFMGAHQQAIDYCNERFKELTAHVATFPLYACRYAMEALLSDLRVDPLAERWLAKWADWIPF